MKPAACPRGRAALAAWLAAGACAFGETSANLASQVPPLPDVGSSVVRVLGALALVLALFFGGVWCLKNWQRISRFKGRPSNLAVLEIRPLDNRHAVYVVGYQRQRMLVGVSPAGITLLSHLPETEEAEAGPAAPASFDAALRQAASHKP